MYYPYSQRIVQKVMKPLFPTALLDTTMAGRRGGGEAGRRGGGEAGTRGRDKQATLDICAEFVEYNFRYVGRGDVGRGDSGT